MLTQYVDFRLDLSWDKNVAGVSVVYKAEAGDIPSSGAIAYKEDLVTAVDPEFDTAFDLAEIIEAGEHIADLLLPKGKIRDHFRALWLQLRRNEISGIRLRLHHLGPNKSDISKLLAIPWEFVYLTPADDEKDKRDFLLALNRDMSIVHSLVPENRFVDRPPEAVPLKMRYFSFLTGRDFVGENLIFQSFLREYHSLSPLVTCDIVENEEGEPSQNIEDYPDINQIDENDVRAALIDNHLVQLVGHGSSDSLQIGEGADFSLNELSDAVSQAGSKLRALIFLSCNSSDGFSISTTVHKAGVPIVVGMTRTIHINPAARFVRGFYNALASLANVNIEQAIVEGRINLFQEGTSRGKWNVSFGLPRLFLSGRDGNLIPESLLLGNDDLIDYFETYITEKISDAEKSEIGVEPNTVAHEIQQKLEDWLDHGGTRWFHVAGQAGSGKTTEIAKFLNKQRNKGRKLIYHFCTHNKPVTGDPLAFVQDSIVRQLIEFYPDRDYSAWFPAGRFPVTTHNAKDALIDFVYTPLAKAREQGYELPVIVIDGLDFVPPDHGIGNSVLGLLRAFYSQLDDVARFIVTTDEIDRDETDLFSIQIAATVKIVTQNAERYLYKPIQNAISEIDKDLSKAFSGTKVVYNIQEFQTEVGDQTALSPSPLLIRLADQCREILAMGPLPGAEPLSLEPEQWSSSLGLQKLIEYIFELVKHLPEKPPWWIEKVQRFLDVVAIAYSPLSLDEIALIINVDQDQRNLLIDVLKPLFAKDRFEEAVSYFHHSLKNYILRDMDRHNRGVTTHRLIVNRFRSEISEWDDQGIVWSQLPDYARRYLINHVYELYRGTKIGEGVRSKRADDFLRLICAPKFRQIRLNEIGRDAVDQEIRFALRVIYSEILYRDDDKSFVTYIDRILALNDFDLQILEEAVRSASDLNHHDRLHKMIDAFQPGFRRDDMGRIKELLLT